MMLLTAFVVDSGEKKALHLVIQRYFQFGSMQLARDIDYVFTIHRMNISDVSKNGKSSKFVKKKENKLTFCSIKLQLLCGRKTDITLKQ